MMLLVESLKSFYGGYILLLYDIVYKWIFYCFDCFNLIWFLCACNQNMEYAKRFEIDTFSCAIEAGIIHYGYAGCADFHHKNVKFPRICWRNMLWRIK